MLASTSSNFVAAVGERVADLLRKWIERGMPDLLLRTLVLDVLDLGDRQVQILLGEHYMPEAGDFEAST